MSEKSLNQIVREVVSDYAGKVLNGYSYLTHNDDDTVFTVVDVARLKRQHMSGVSLVVRIAGNKVIIERDQNDKLLVDALIQAGVAREDIILAYAGEPVPDLVS